MRYFSGEFASFIAGVLSKFNHPFEGFDPQPILIFSAGCVY